MKDLTIQVLKKALAAYSPPDIHHSDQGVQYATSKSTILFTEVTKISMSKIGRPTENGIVEKFF
jgi:transposase InsO family protein